MGVFLSRRTALCGLLAAALAPAMNPTLALAEAAWPTKPVRILVTFPPGGTSDIVARLIGQHLTEKFGQQFLVDNRPGAGGTIAGEIVKKEAPDGHTLFLANNAPFTISPTQFKKIPYDPIADFTHVAYIGASYPGLFVQPALGIKDLNGFIEKAKAEPAKLNYGSSGVGSIHHILGESLKKKTSINVVHVPYKGTAPAIQDFKAGVLKSFSDLLAQNAPMIKAGDAIAVAVAAPRRVEQLPDVPTFQELGIDLVLPNWLGISAPAGLPPEITTKIHAAVEEVLELPSVKERLYVWGIETVRMTTPEYTKFVVDTMETWRPLIIEAGAQEK